MYCNSKPPFFTFCFVSCCLGPQQMIFFPTFIMGCVWVCMILDFMGARKCNCLLSDQLFLKRYQTTNFRDFGPLLMDCPVCKIGQHSPCLLNESDDKLSHLNWFISLKCDDFLLRMDKSRKCEFHFCVGSSIGLHELVKTVQTALTSRKLSSNEGSLLIINSCT